MSDMRTIRVTGKGLIKVHPDMTRVTIELTKRSMDYGETLALAARDTEQLKDLLAPFGFARSDLKTLDFGVETEYENYQEKNAWKRRFIGYKYSHTMKVEFDSDNKLLGRVLYALANCPLRPEFRLSYTVKDPEKVKNELLGKAVQDAKTKAAVLAEAAGVKLRDIRSMDYSWSRVDFEISPMSKGLEMEKCMPIGDGGFDMDIEPDDLEVTDTVTLVWEIG